MSASRKAARYLQSLRSALDGGRYSELPELSRKLQKHDTSSVCFAKSAEVQGSLLQKLEKAQDTIDNANFNSPEGTFQWLAVDVAHLSREETLLQEAFAARNTASKEDQTYYDVTNLFLGIVVRQLHSAVNLATRIGQQNAHPAAHELLALLGILEELLGRSEEAISHYRNYLRLPKPDDSPLWHEHVLYRLAILSPSQTTYDQFMTRNAHGRNRGGVRVLQVLGTRNDPASFLQALFKNTKFPPAQSSNFKLLAQVSQVMDAWIAAGSDPLTAEKQLDLLHETASKTFHAPRVLRYLIHVLTALERHEEVLLALNAYLQVAVHAQKTRQSTDSDGPRDIFETVRFVVTTTLKSVSPNLNPHLEATELSSRLSKIAEDLSVSDATCRAILREVLGVAHLLTYQATHDTGSLKAAIPCLKEATTTLKNVNTCIELAIAYAQTGDLPAAMGSIHQALQLEDSHIPALLTFANLLCCEELDQRAVLVLEKVATLSEHKESQNTQDKKRKVLAASMQLKVIERLDGPAKALEDSPHVLSVYGQCFSTGASTTTTPQTAQERVSATLHNHTSPPVVPTVQIENEGHGTIPPSQALPDLVPSTNSTSTTPPNARLHPNYTNGKIRSTSAASTTNSSLRTIHRRRHFPTHLHVPKSTSNGSLRGHDSIEHDSSRSSSPLNHPPPSVHSILPETSLVLDPVEMDHQASGSEILIQTQNALLADIWLDIARLCQAAGAPQAEASQAIDEARALIGTTSAILTMQLDLRLAALRAQPATASAHQVAEIQSGYEYALAMNETCPVTILSYARFLMDKDKEGDEDEAEDASFTAGVLPQHGASKAHMKPAARALSHGRLARSYELLESLKSTGCRDPALWLLSGDLAVKRGQVDRAEEEYWHAVEASDVAGVVDWYTLWRA